MRQKFTKRWIEGLPTPSKRKFYYDQEIPGLAICVLPNGDKTFYVSKWIGTNTKKFRLGRYPTMTIGQAREEALETIQKLERGQLPRTKPQSEPTFQDLFDHWMQHVKVHNRTWKADERTYERFLKPWAKRRLSTILENHIRKLHSSIGAENGPYMANRVLEKVRAMFNKAREIGYQGANPAIGIKMYREKERERFLYPHEMKRFADSLEKEEPLFRDFFLVALLTGARRSNVQSMRWDEIVGDTWQIPSEKAKEGEMIVIPLIEKVVAILEKRRTIVGDSPWVFPSPRTGSHLADPRKAWKRVCERAGIKDLRMHDLRRSLGSYQAINGSSLIIIGQSLGHSPGSRATDRYSRLNNQTVRQSVQKAADSMFEAMEG